MNVRFNPPPGWPQPPVGFVPEPGWQPDPSWPPAPYGWFWWVPERPVRSRERRVGLTILYALIPSAVSAVCGFVTGFCTALAIRPGNYATHAAYEKATQHALGIFTGALCVFVGLGIPIAFAFIAPKVSYRRRDCLFLLIPFYGTYMYFKFLWRLAYLPDRDWPVRLDEQPRAVHRG